MTESMWIQHVNVIVDDLEAASVFYGEVLGLEAVPAPEMGFPAQFFKVNDTQEIHVNELRDRPPERAHFCLQVSHFDSLFVRVHELGIIEHETWGKVRRLPTGGMQLFIRDPAGNLVEIACPADQPVDPAIFELDVVDSETRFFNRSP